MKKPLILIPSTLMDSNKKRSRKEDTLIRVGSKARTYLELDNEKSVELYPTNTPRDRINRNKILSIFQAFSEDLNRIKTSGMSQEELLRVGFVTTKTFNYICGNGASSKNDIWISQSISDTVIGADPEFILLKNNKYVNAAHVVSYHGELGSDGPLAEIRPNPEIEVEAFVNSIRNILTNHPHTKDISEYTWKSACCWQEYYEDEYDPDVTERYTYPVGGHIHIGTPAVIAKKFGEDSFTYYYYQSLVRILDELLAIPLMRIDNKEESILRRDSYGQYGDYRTDNGRLEYRTLSGMWISHPKLALMVVGTAKAIIDAYFKMLEAKSFNTEYLGNGIIISKNKSCFNDNFDGWKDIEIMKDFNTTMSSQQLREILHSYKIKYTKEYITKLTEKFRRLPTYNKYAEYIDGLLELISLPKDRISKINTDLKETWVQGADFII